MVGKAADHYVRAIASVGRPPSIRRGGQAAEDFFVVCSTGEPSLLLPPLACRDRVSSRATACIIARIDNASLILRPIFRAERIHIQRHIYCSEDMIRVNVAGQRLDLEQRMDALNARAH